MTSPTGPQPGPTSVDPLGALPALLSSDMVDAYSSGDQDTLLRWVGSTIRDACRWHIFPSVPVTNLVCRVCSDGCVLLPSLYVTAVTAVTTVVAGNPSADQVLPSTSWNWSGPPTPY